MKKGISVLLEEDILKQLETVGKKLDRSRNYLITKAIENYLNQKGGADIKNSGSTMELKDEGKWSDGECPQTKLHIKGKLK